MAIEAVQVDGNYVTGDAASIAASFDSNVQSGNLIVLHVKAGSDYATISSVVDAQTNSYSLAYGPWLSGGRNWIYYCENVTGGFTTITVNWDTERNNCGLSIAEFSGILTSSSKDQDNEEATAGPTIASTGDVTTTVANEVLFGGIEASGRTVEGRGTGVVDVYYASGIGFITSYRIVSSTGTYDINWTFNDSVYATAAIVSFKGQDSVTPLYIKVKKWLVN